MQISRTMTQHTNHHFVGAFRRQPTTTAGATITQGPQHPNDNMPATNAATPDSAKSSGATVRLVPGAQLFARAVAGANAASDVRADRVAAIRAQIANGTYVVDVHALAAKMLGIGDR